MWSFIMHFNSSLKYKIIMQLCCLNLKSEPCNSGQGYGCWHLLTRGKKVPLLSQYPHRPEFSKKLNILNSSIASSETGCREQELKC
jgi:hypothetical protein